jgi:phage baseplate assembly protein W
MMNGDPAGPAFPFRIDPLTGRVATSAGSAKLRDNLKHLLLTRIGERLMVREYGGGVTQLLHENVNDALVTVAQHQVGRAIVRFEPRVLPQDIAVVPRGAELFLRIEYAEPGTPGIQTTVIPVT